MKVLMYFIRLILPVMPHVLVAVVLSIFAALSSVALMATAAWLIAFASYHPPLYELSLAIIGVRFFGIVRAIARYGERYVSHDATFHILSKLRVTCYEQLEKIMPIQECKFTNSDLANLLLRQIDTLKDFYLRVLSPVLTAIVVLFVMVVVMAFYVPYLSLIYVGAFILIAIVIPYLIFCINRKNLIRIENDKEKLNNQYIDAVYGIRDLIACNRATDCLMSISLSVNKTNQLRKKVFGINALNNALAEMVGAFCIIMAICLLIPLVRENLITGVHLAVIILTMQSSFEPMFQLPVVWHYFALSSDAVKQLDFLTKDKKDDEKGEKTINALTRSAEKNVPLLEVKNVSFAYGNNRAVFSDLNFTLQQGERIAIVGESGVGKSTLAYLLLNLYNVAKGQIKLKGRLYKELNADVIRSNFNSVMQEKHFFHQTIKENMQLLCPDAKEGAIWKALQKVKLDHLVGEMPDGVNTVIGQKGNRLSGGQRQRLAIACAVLKTAPILLLDEPTVGVDMVTAKEIMETIFGLPKEQAIILITHDLVGLEKMDQIIVLKNGSVAEMGNYLELVGKQGLFYKMLKYT